MSKRPFITQDCSPNILIVPTLSFCEPPTKTTKTDNEKVQTTPCTQTLSLSKSSESSFESITENTVTNTSAECSDTKSGDSSSSLSIQSVNATPRPRPSSSWASSYLMSIGDSHSPNKLNLSPFRKKIEAPKENASQNKSAQHGVFPPAEIKTGTPIEESRGPSKITNGSSIRRSKDNLTKNINAANLSSLPKTDFTCDETNITRMKRPSENETQKSAKRSKISSESNQRLYKATESHTRHGDKIKAPITAKYISTPDKYKYNKYNQSSSGRQKTTKDDVKKPSYLCKSSCCTAKDIRDKIKTSQNKIVKKSKQNLKEMPVKKYTTEMHIKSTVTKKPSSVKHKEPYYSTDYLKSYKNYDVQTIKHKEFYNKYKIPKISDRNKKIGENRRSEETENDTNKNRISAKDIFVKELGEADCSTPIKSVVKVADDPDRKVNKSFDLRSKLSRRSLNDHFTKLRNLSAPERTHTVPIEDRESLIITLPNDTDDVEVKPSTKTKLDDGKISKNKENIKTPTKKECISPKIKEVIRSPKTKEVKTPSSKFKKIKLVLNVICEKSGTSSSDSEDEESLENSDADKKDIISNLDLSFLDDFNIDEIVESLNGKGKCELTSSTFKDNTEDDFNLKSESDHINDIDVTEKNIYSAVVSDTENERSLLMEKDIKTKEWTKESDVYQRSKNIECEKAINTSLNDSAQEHKLNPIDEVLHVSSCKLPMTGIHNSENDTETKKQKNSESCDTLSVKENLESERETNAPLVISNKFDTLKTKNEVAISNEIKHRNEVSVVLKTDKLGAGINNTREAITDINTYQETNNNMAIIKFDNVCSSDVSSENISEPSSAVLKFLQTNKTRSSEVSKSSSDVYQRSKNIECEKAINTSLNDSAQEHKLNPIDEVLHVSSCKLPMTGIHNSEHDTETKKQKNSESCDTLSVKENLESERETNAPLVISNKFDTLKTKNEVAISNEIKHRNEVSVVLETDKLGAGINNTREAITDINTYQETNNNMAIIKFDNVCSSDVSSENISEPSSAVLKFLQTNKTRSSEVSKSSSDVYQRSKNIECEKAINTSLNDSAQEHKLNPIDEVLHVSSCKLPMTGIHNSENDTETKQQKNSESCDTLSVKENLESERETNAPLVISNKFDTLKMENEVAISNEIKHRNEVSVVLETDTKDIFLSNKMPERNEINSYETVHNSISIARESSETNSIIYKPDVMEKTNEAMVIRKTEDSKKEEKDETLANSNESSKSNNKQDNYDDIMTNINESDDKGAVQEKRDVLETNHKRITKINEPTELTNNVRTEDDGEFENQTKHVGKEDEENDMKQNVTNQEILHTSDKQEIENNSTMDELSTGVNDNVELKIEATHQNSPHQSDPSLKTQSLDEKIKDHDTDTENKNDNELPSITNDDISEKTIDLTNESDEDSEKVKGNDVANDRESVTKTNERNPKTSETVKENCFTNDDVLETKYIDFSLNPNTRLSDITIDLTQESNDNPDTANLKENCCAKEPDVVKEMCGNKNLSVTNTTKGNAIEVRENCVNVTNDVASVTKTSPESAETCEENCAATEESGTKTNERKNQSQSENTSQSSVINNTDTVSEDKTKDKPEVTEDFLQIDASLAKKITDAIQQWSKKKHTIKSLIHNGQFSKIYECVNECGDKYAVKIMHGNIIKYRYSKTESIMKRLQRDVPNENYHCVYLFQGFGSTTNWCLLTELYPKNLKQALQENEKSFHINLIQDLSRQLVSAVTLLRHKNIVHTNIKPTHILMNSTNDQLKLCGFDEAQYVGGIQFARDVGAMNYRAPEIILGHSAGFQMDVWSTALVMYEMATNIQLFPGIVHNDILYKQMFVCGPVPYEMLKASKFKNEHFSGHTFLRQIKDGVCSKIPCRIMYKHDLVKKYVYLTYKQDWHGVTSYKQKQKDYAKLQDFCQLIHKMLTMDPQQRLPIEFVFADPFIYETTTDDIRLKPSAGKIKS